MRTSHEDLSDLLPDIEAVEQLIRPEAEDDNGRGSGSIIALLRDPTGIVLYICSSTWLKTGSNMTYCKFSFLCECTVTVHGI